MKRLFFKSAVIAALTALLVPGSIGALTIDKVVPFATDHEVKLQVALSSATPGQVELKGSIDPASTAHSAGVASNLWSGDLGRIEISSGSAMLERTIRVSNPQLWTPGSPFLYNLTVTATQGAEPAHTEPVRFGFRSVSARDGQILLNGKPIFLKGIAINPPGRDIPDEIGYSKQFATDYVRYLRSQNVNLIRMTFDFKPEPRQQAWFDACDELGMMVDQGNYGGPPGLSKKGPSVDPEEQPDAFAGKDPNAPRSSKSAPPESFEASISTYKEVFETYARHPSIIIYILANELPGPVGSKPEWHDFLIKADERINAWDPTRLVIGNAGYGLGREGDINDVHRYWGWYYNSFLTYYNLRDTVGLFGQSTDKQPFTFSECVGSFTSPLGAFNAIYKKQLAPQLGWTGHSGEQSKDALAYQAFMVKHALESFRTMREQNPRISGLMPFTIQFFNWEGIHSFDQMKPKPSMEQMGVSYSPILTSIELWTPQVFANSRIRPVIHVVNDAEDFSALTDAKLSVALLNASGAAAWNNAYQLPAIGYYKAQAFSTPIQVPSVPTGNYFLVAEVQKNGKAISRNQESIYVRGAEQSNAFGEELPVFDPKGATLRMIKSLGFNPVSVQNLSSLPAGSHQIVIGEQALNGVIAPAVLKQFVMNGGRVLCMAQDQQADISWMPAKLKMLEGTATDPTYTPKIRPTADQQNVNPERPWHPVFTEIGRERLRLWSDYTDWDQSKPGFPNVYPVTHGFKLTDAADLARTAVLADYDRGLEGIAIAELFDGKGSVIFTGLDMVNRNGIDPVASDMLRNLLNYLRVPDHERYPLIEKPITWGDYPTERGVLTGPVQGLIYNCRWVAPPTAPNATPMADNTGAWNTHPGNPFVPKGIRPFGPYTWSTGASPREESNAPTGTGIFYCRVPAGRKSMISKVENTQQKPLALQVTINGALAQASTILPAQAASIRTPILGGATDLAISYTGDKQLVILETSFE